MTNDANTCPTCQRKPAYFEGCSVVECPKRRLLTACPTGYSDIPNHVDHDTQDDEPPRVDW